MTHASGIQKAAQAAFEEYQHLDQLHIGTMVWDDLHEGSKANWCHIVRVVLNAYNEEKV